MISRSREIIINKKDRITLFFYFVVSHLLERQLKLFSKVIYTILCRNKYINLHPVIPQTQL